MLGEDLDWLRDISIEMEPEGGIISVYGIGEEGTPASPTSAFKPQIRYRMP
jgi:hypothetical protein